MEFQTPGMLEEAVGQEYITLHLSIEEAEALGRATRLNLIKDKKTKALAEQALDQVGLLCRQVRERVRVGDTFISSETNSLQPKDITEPQPAPEAVAPAPRPRLRPLGDPDNLSLKEAGEILGKARNTLHLWYRSGKFPPVIDVGPYLGGSNRPTVVVPRYRLEAWQAGERMPNIFQKVFERHRLREPPWVCYTARRGVHPGDVEFWVERRGLSVGTSRDRRRIFGHELEEGKAYELSSMP